MSDEATQNLLKHLWDTSQDNRIFRSRKKIMRRTGLKPYQLDEDKEWLEQVTKEYEQQKEG